MPDGRALLAADERQIERVRASLGRHQIRARARLPDPGWMEEVVAALAPNGGAVIAYRNPDTRCS
jgi:hypothetical protein